MMNTTITTKLEWHPSHFNYTLVLKKLENTSQTQHCSIALKCNRLVFTMNMKPNMSIRSFVFYFCLNSGEFRSFFWSKFLCVGWNHIFQVQIWQNLTQKENTGLWAIQDSIHAKFLRTQRRSPTKKGSSILMMLYFSIIWKTCGKLQSKQYTGLSAMRYFPY
jgi:hypothetical protein